MNPEELAEVATLGGLLLDVDARNRLSWLRSGDFADPWHRDLHSVIAEDTAAGRGSDLPALAAALRERVGGRRAELHRMQQVLAATPVRPHTDRYARMVLEASLRRDIAMHGVLLRAGAVQAALTGTSQPATTAVGLVRAGVHAAARRWQQATGEPVVDPTRPGGSAAAGRAAPVSLSWLAGADRYVTAHPALDTAAVHEHERELVASLVTRSSAVHAVAAWLRPADLTDPGWAAVYEAVLALAEAGDPIDEVTVTWQVHRASLRLGAGPEDLHDAIDSAVTSDPRRCARLLAGDLVRRTADHAAASLHATAANPGLAVADLLHTTELLTRAVQSAAAGLPPTQVDPESRRRLQLVPTVGPARVEPPAVAG